MRPITAKAVQKFLNAETFKMSNTEVEVLANVTILKLFGNAIAYRYNDPERTLSITNCKFKSFNELHIFKYSFNFINI